MSRPRPLRARTGLSMDEATDIGWLYVCLGRLQEHQTWHIMEGKGMRRLRHMTRHIRGQATTRAYEWVNEYTYEYRSLCRVAQNTYRWERMVKLEVLPMPWRERDPLTVPPKSGGELTGSLLPGEPVELYCRRCVAALCEQTHIPLPDPTKLRLSLRGGRRA